MMKATRAASLILLAFFVSSSRLQASCRGSCADATAPTNTVGVALTPEDKQHLLLMQDEEKLARDVYNAFAKQWKLRPFENIGTRSEPVHMEAVTALLRRHQAEPSPQPEAAGEFRSAEMKKLYDGMIASGSASAVEALQIAVEIEELDIKDLREGAAKSGHAEVKSLYANLEAASIRHLQAFLRNLEARGGTYTPKHLDAKTFGKLAAGETGDQGDGTPVPGRGRGRGWGAAGRGTGPDSPPGN